MKRGKKRIAIALSIAMMLPSVAAPGTITAKAAETDDVQIVATAEDGAEKDDIVVEDTDIVSETEDADSEEADVDEVVEGVALDTATPMQEDLNLLTAGEVTINETNFPDSVFRTYITENFDSDGSGVLTAAEIAAVKTIDVSGKTIYSLTGINYFTGLTNLNCSSTKITELNVDALTSLQSLNCARNSITSLNVDNNTKLSELYCDGTDLSALYLNNNSELTTLSCGSTLITTLALTNNPNLIYLDFSNTSVSTIDLTSATQLTYLNCSSNTISSLNLSKNLDLQILKCCNMTALNTLDVSNHDALQELDCSSNMNVSGALTSVNASGNEALTTINCSGNSISSLNISGDTALTSLDCSKNKLSAIDVASNTALETLAITDNLLADATDIVLSNNTNLLSLDCEKNKLESIDVSANTALQTLNVNANQLKELNVSANTALVTLTCNQNALTVLNLDNNAALTKLECNENQLTWLDISKTAVSDISCTGNSYEVSLDKYYQYSMTNLPNDGWKLASSEDEAKYKDGSVRNATFEGNGYTLTPSLNVSYATYVYNLGNGKTATFTLTFVNPLKVTVLLDGVSSTFSNTTAKEFWKDSTIQCTAIHTTTKEPLDYITWSSTDTNVFTVDPNSGELVAVNPGEAQLIVNLNNRALGYINLKIKQPIETINLSDTSITLTNGTYSTNKTATLSATVGPENATILSDTTKASVVWSSANPAVATVNAATGEVTAAGKGTTKIICTANDGSGVTAECTVTVNQMVDQVKLSATSVDVSSGGTRTLTATIVPSTADNQAVTWSSADTGIATVNQSGVVTGVSEGTTIIYCTSQENASVIAQCQVNVKPGPTSVDVSAGTNILYIGGTIAEKSTTLTATVYPASASQTVTYTSSDPSIATVSAAGKVTAVKAGTVTITCYSENDAIKATYTITVRQLATSVAITRSVSSTVLLTGKTMQLTATVSPETTYDKSVTWESSDEGIASVSANGLVTAISAGKATITCTTSNGKTRALTLTINQAVTDITVSKTSLTLMSKGNNTATLTAVVSPSNAANKNVYWTSSNNNVVTVGKTTGIVTAKAAGKATITCTPADGSGVAKVISVTVNQAVTAITLNKTSVSILNGKTVSLTAAVSPSTAYNKTVKWTSSNPAIATVSSTGVVTAKKVGTVKITCTAGDGSGVTKVCTVTVKQPVTKITLKSTTTTSVFVGKSITLKATIAPTTAASKKVTWKSSNTKIATVSSTGVVKGIKKGTVTITCTAADGSGIKKTIKITVKQPVTSIKLNKTSYTLKKGKTVTLKATVKPTTANNKNVTWKSSNTKVATVSASGKVTGKKAGIVTITCTAKDGSGKKATCKITVK